MIYLGADHGGFGLKEKIKTWLKDWGYEFTDKGALKLDPEDDYPDFAFAVADEVSSHSDPAKPWEEQDKGILLCRSAAGMIIAANKVPGIRAAAAYDVKGAVQPRTNDDVNILGLSGDWLDDQTAKAIIKAFLETEYSHGERHQRRLDKITEAEIDGGCCGGECGNC